MLLNRLSFILFASFYQLTKFTLADDAMSDTTRSEEHSVYRVWPRTKSQLNYLIALERNATSLSLDFWKSPSDLNLPVDLMIEQNNQKRILNELKSRGIKFSPMIDSVEE